MFPVTISLSGVTSAPKPRFSGCSFSICCARAFIPANEAESATPSFNRAIAKRPWQPLRWSQPVRSLSGVQNSAGPRGTN